VAVLLSGDTHVEPWYDVTNSGHVAGDDRVTRCTACATLADMFAGCWDGTTNASAACRLTGESDPPIGLWESHLDAFSAAEAAARKPWPGLPPEVLPMRPDGSLGLFFFVGDAQAHDYAAPYLGGVDEPSAVARLQTAALRAALRRLPARHVAWTVGNNDGPHGEAFVAQDADTVALAGAVLASGVVASDLGWTYGGDGRPGVELSQEGMFNRTGYYVKPLDPLDELGLRSAGLYVMVANTNLGASNVVQSNAIATDCARIRSAGGRFYLLGHHPDTTPYLLPEGCRDLCRGSMSGHVHYAADTDESGFTQVPAISQAAETTGFFIASISADNDFALEVTTAHDLWTYGGEAGRAASAADWTRRAAGAAVAGR